MGKKKSLGRASGSAGVSEAEGEEGAARNRTAARVAGPAEEGRRPGKWLAMAAPALALLAGLPTLAFDFAGDDLPQIMANPLIDKLANLPAAFTPAAWKFAPADIGSITRSYYRPLFNSLLLILNATFDHSPWGWHLVIVLLHIAATAVVYLIVRDLFERPGLAAATACLFAVLPVHVEAVAWVSGGVEVLSGLLLLAAFHCYLRYRRSQGAHYLALAAVSFLLGLWANESALGFPLIVAYMEVAGPARSGALRDVNRQARNLGRPFAIGLSLGLPTLVYALMRASANGTLLASDEVRWPLWASLQTMPLAVAKYAGLVVWPFGYSLIHDTPLVTSVWSLRLLGPLAAIAVVVTLLVRYADPRLRFAVWWFVLALVPVLLTINRLDSSHLVQERYVYLPSMGFCLAAALGVEWVAARASFAKTAGRSSFAVVGVLVVFYGIIFIVYSRSWQDSLAVYRRAVAAAPDSAASHAALAGWYASAGRPRDAQTEAQRAIELDPQSFDANLELAYLTFQQGKIDGAIDILEGVRTQLAPLSERRTDLATVELNLARLYSQKKDERAIEHASESLDLWERPAGWYYKALILFGSGHWVESLPVYQETMRRLPPRYAQIHLSIAAVYERLDRLQEAREEYLNYMALAPPDAPDLKSVQNQLRNLNDKIEKQAKEKVR